MCVNHTQGYLVSKLVLQNACVRLPMAAEKGSGRYASWPRSSPATAALPPPRKLPLPVRSGRPLACKTTRFSTLHEHYKRAL